MLGIQRISWVFGVSHIIDNDDAAEMARALAYDLAKNAYNLGA